MDKLMLAMSGGVDSSVALLLLKEKYDIIGGTLRLVNKSGDDTGMCGSSKDIEDARKIAEKYGIPHHVFSMEELFEKEVIDSFTKSYLNGMTPNPCIECNEKIKFGALLKRARELGCEYIATGHYARTVFDEKSGRYLLLKSVFGDGTPNPKDQSYVLYRLSQQQLKPAVFPLGGMDKSEIREIAKNEGLINSDKSDSQDICFVTDGKYGEFITDRLKNPSPEGNFLDTNGNIIGRHKGQLYYTVGQRRGIGVGFGRPVYVISKNAAENTVTLGDNEFLFTDTLYANNLNWIAFDTPPREFTCKAKTRYKQTEQPCTVYLTDNDRIRVVFEEKIRAVTPGQHVVLYDGDVVLGGGVIE